MFFIWIKIMAIAQDQLELGMRLEIFIDMKSKKR